MLDWPIAGLTSSGASDLLFGRSCVIVGHHRLTDEFFPAAAVVIHVLVCLQKLSRYVAITVCDRSSSLTEDVGLCHYWVEPHLARHRIAFADDPL